MSCDHNRKDRKFISSSHGGNRSASVFICAGCGRFEVLTEKNGEHVTCYFTLYSRGLIETAMKALNRVAIEEGRHEYHLAQPLD